MDSAVASTAPATANRRPERAASPAAVLIQRARCAFLGVPMQPSHEELMTEDRRPLGVGSFPGMRGRPSFSAGGGGPALGALPASTAAATGGGWHPDRDDSGFTLVVMPDMLDR